MASMSRRMALLAGVAAATIAAGCRRPAAGVPLRRQGRQGRLLRSLAAHRFEGSPGEAPVAQFHREQHDAARDDAGVRALSGDALHVRVRRRVRERGRPPQPARRSVHDRQRRGRQGRGAIEEADGRATGAGAAGRRQAHRQGLQRGALDGHARRGRLSEIGAAPPGGQGRLPRPRRPPRRRPLRPRRCRCPARVTRRTSTARDSRRGIARPVSRWRAPGARVTPPAEIDAPPHLAHCRRNDSP